MCFGTTTETSHMGSSGHRMHHLSAFAPDGIHKMFNYLINAIGLELRSNPIIAEHEVKIQACNNKNTNIIATVKTDLIYCIKSFLIFLKFDS